MVLENTDSFAKKANPLGQEAPYQDWEIVGEDLVDYEDKDARGLEFVFSVFRNNANSAMQKVVSVYQKPSDDQTGAFVIVSMAVDNKNDIRVYEISNTAYGNEPEDPQVFLRKVIEMADDSGMIREVADYGSFGMQIETADDVGTTSKGSPFQQMRAAGQQAAQTNRTFQRFEGQSKGASNNFQAISQSLPGGFVTGAPEPVSASKHKTHFAGLESDAHKEAAYGIHQHTKNTVSGGQRNNPVNALGEQAAKNKNKPNFEQPINKVEKSTTEQLKGEKHTPGAKEQRPDKNDKGPDIKRPGRQDPLNYDQIKEQASKNSEPRNKSILKTIGNYAKGALHGLGSSFGKQLMGTTQGATTDGGAIVSETFQGGRKQVIAGEKAADKAHATKNRGKLTEKDIMGYEKQKMKTEYSRDKSEEKYGTQDTERAKAGDDKLQRKAKNVSSKKQTTKKQTAKKTKTGNSDKAATEGIKNMQKSNKPKATEESIVKNLKDSGVQVEKPKQTKQQQAMDLHAKMQKLGKK